MKITHAAIATLAALMAMPAASAAVPPKLIVAIAVDQFSADLFGEYRARYTGGLRRLADAIVFPNGFQSHAATETCPGHATLLTGARPARTGVIANGWFDLAVTRGPKRSHEVYCAEDESQPGTTTSDYVVSSVHLKMPTMGDRMKRADPRSRVVSVAGKDRAAVMMGGHATDALWYLDSKTSRSFVTLAGRTGKPPAVIQRVNSRIAGLMAAPPSPVVPPACAAMAVPLPVGTEGMTVGVPVPPPAGDAKAFRATPGLDTATADIAIGLIEEMRLGRGPAPDLIAIGLSATDYIGHSFGTEGGEMCAQQFALDATIGRILAALDATGMPYAVVLSADHGGLDLAERHQRRGFADARRVSTGFSTEAIGAALAKQFALSIDPKTLLLADGASGDWYLSNVVPGALRPQLLAAARAHILADPDVADVITADDLRRMPMPRYPVDGWSLAERARASFDPARSGDLVVLLKPRVSPIANPGPGRVTTHGSPWDYDRRVPILFLTPGGASFEEPLSIETIDILPTLAPLIGLDVPAGEIDGRCLDLDPGTTTSCTP